MVLILWISTLSLKHVWSLVVHSTQFPEYGLCSVADGIQAHCIHMLHFVFPPSDRQHRDWLCNSAKCELHSSDCEGIAVYLHSQCLIAVFGDSHFDLKKRFSMQFQGATRPFFLLLFNCLPCQDLCSHRILCFLGKYTFGQLWSQDLLLQFNVTMCLDV